MNHAIVRLERALLALFIASGFSGLIYQAIWSHYLGLSLGHAAYAQTLVLAIFMGGMAGGAWFVSRYGVRWRRLIACYAVVEVVIGLAGLLFHPVFVAYTGFSQDTVYPALESAAAVRGWQWGTAALLIAPQTILLGMTFPLMSGGYLRVAPRADGEILGGLYFTNSIGAAFGALFATFVLLPWGGMPGAIMVAGVVNLAVGVLAFLVAGRADGLGTPETVPAAAPAPVPEAPPAGPAAAGPDAFQRMMLTAALVTGATSFVYEIGWVRLLNQSLGTTVHSFELMLSAFILGLAFGGLWIRRRSRRIDDTVAYAGYAQVWMGIAALVSIPVFSRSFQWVGAMMAALPRTDGGYTLFSLGSGGIALLVMFPAAFFAGMTLPLFTMALLRRGAGEASIGRIYAANTVGAIGGVMLAVHVLIPVLGLRLAVTFAAIVDILLGLVLLRLYASRVRPRGFALATAASLLVVAGSLAFSRLDPRALASGVFRHGVASLEEDVEVHYLRDGKTASVSFVTRGTVAVIATNGKPDASVQMLYDGEPTPDEITMAMASALPLVIHPAPHDVAVIGWGSGLTTHALLGSPVPRKVDSIEIERAMYDAAANFGSRVRRGYADPRSMVHIDDARTYFSTGHRRYDVIISEPSNPWVSGVAGLFTREFYGFLGEHLNEGGIVVQWLQVYELDDPLLMTMMAALIDGFAHVDAYTTNGSDLLVVASGSPLPPLDYDRIAGTELAAELARVGLAGPADFEVRKVGGRDTLQALVALYGAVPHSDFHPVVALDAPRARFVNASVQSFATLARVGMPVLELTGGWTPPAAAGEVTLRRDAAGAHEHWTARLVRDALRDGEPGGLQAVDPAVAEAVARLRAASAAPVGDDGLADWLAAVTVVSDYSIGYLPAGDHAGVWIDPAWIDAGAQPPVVQAVLAAYAAAAARDGAAMEAAGRAVLPMLGDGAPVALREQMLVVAMLGVIAQGRHGDVAAIEREFGRGLRPGPDYGFVRSFLLAWVDVVAPTPSPAS